MEVEMRKIIIFTVLFFFTFGVGFVYANDNTDNSNENNQRKPPMIIYAPAPEYPPEARKQKLEGKVKLKITISDEGEVSKAEVSESSGYDFFDNAALDAIKNWRFTPAEENGHLIEEIRTIKIIFRFEEPNVQKNP